MEANKPHMESGKLLKNLLDIILMEKLLELDTLHLLRIQQQRLSFGLVNGHGGQYLC